MITERSAGISVIEPSGVPVQNIADDVFNYKTIDWLCERYPIEPQDVFEAIEFACHSLGDWDDSIELENTGDDANIRLSTKRLNKTSFFHLLMKGRKMRPMNNDFFDLYRIGLMYTIRDIFVCLVQGVDVPNTPEHRAVYNGGRGLIEDLEHTVLQEYIKAIENE